MKNETFKVELQLGNDAMSTSEDVIQALKMVIKELEIGSGGGKVLDDNGNTVGHFTFE